MGGLVSRVLYASPRDCHLSVTYVTVSLSATCRMSGKQCSAYGVASDRVYICTQLPAVPVSFYLAFPSVPSVLPQLR